MSQCNAVHHGWNARCRLTTGHEGDHQWLLGTNPIEKKDQWEYMFYETDLDEFTLPQLKNYWDVEGEQGWELVSMVMAHNTLIAAFKRKLTS